MSGAHTGPRRVVVDHSVMQIPSPPDQVVLTPGTDSNVRFHHGPPQQYMGNRATWNEPHSEHELSMGAVPSSIALPLPQHFSQPPVQDGPYGLPQGSAPGGFQMPEPGQVLPPREVSQNGIYHQPANFGHGDNYTFGDHLRPMLEEFRDGLPDQSTVAPWMMHQQERPPTEPGLMFVPDGTLPNGRAREFIHNEFRQPLNHREMLLPVNFGPNSSLAVDERRFPRVPHREIRGQGVPEAAQRDWNVAGIASLDGNMVHARDQNVYGEGRRSGFIYEEDRQEARVVHRKPATSSWSSPNSHQHGEERWRFSGQSVKDHGMAPNELVDVSRGISRPASAAQERQLHTAALRADPRNSPPGPTVAAHPQHAAHLSRKDNSQRYHEVGKSFSSVGPATRNEAGIAKSSIRARSMSTTSQSSVVKPPSTAQGKVQGADKRVSSKGSHTKANARADSNSAKPGRVVEKSKQVVAAKPSKDEHGKGKNTGDIAGKRVPKTTKASDARVERNNERATVTKGATISSTGRDEKSRSSKSITTRKHSVSPASLAPPQGDEDKEAATVGSVEWRQSGKISASQAKKVTDNGPGMNPSDKDNVARAMSGSESPKSVLPPPRAAVVAEHSETWKGTTRDEIGEHKVASSAVEPPFKGARDGYALILVGAATARLPPETLKSVMRIPGARWISRYDLPHLSKSAPTIEQSLARTLADVFSSRTLVEDSETGAEFLLLFTFSSTTDRSKVLTKLAELRLITPKPDEDILIRVEHLRKVPESPSRPVTSRSQGAPTDEKSWDPKLLETEGPPSNGASLRDSGSVPEVARGEVKTAAMDVKEQQVLGKVTEGEHNDVAEDSAPRDTPGEDCASTADAATRFISTVTETTANEGADRLASPSPLVSTKRGDGGEIKLGTTDVSSAERTASRKSPSPPSFFASAETDRIFDGVATELRESRIDVDRLSSNPTEAVAVETPLAPISPPPQGRNLSPTRARVPENRPSQKLLRSSKLEQLAVEVPATASDETRRTWPYGFRGPYFKLLDKNPRTGGSEACDPARNSSYIGVLPAADVILEGFLEQLRLRRSAKAAKAKAVAAAEADSAEGSTTRLVGQSSISPGLESVSSKAVAQTSENRPVHEGASESSRREEEHLQKITGSSKGGGIVVQDGREGEEVLTEGAKASRIREVEQALRIIQGTKIPRAMEALADVSTKRRKLEAAVSSVQAQRADAIARLAQDSRDSTRALLDELRARRIGTQGDLSLTTDAADSSRGTAGGRFDEDGEKHKEVSSIRQSSQAAESRNVTSTRVTSPSTLNKDPSRKHTHRETASNRPLPTNASSGQVGAEAPTEGSSELDTRKNNGGNRPQRGEKPKPIMSIGKRKSFSVNDGERRGGKHPRP